MFTLPDNTLLALVLISLLVIAPLLGADDSELQVNWIPNVYKVVCNPPDTCNQSKVFRDQAEVIMPQAVNGIRQLNFKAPAFWGKRKGKGTADDYMVIVDKAKSSVAYTVSRCVSRGYEYSFMGIGNDFSVYGDRDHLIYYFLAHEVFHVLQNEYPFVDPVGCNNVPGWVKESTATAVGQAATRNRYPSYFPEKHDEQVAGNFSGMRRYDKPLSDVKFIDGEEKVTGDMDAYRVSAFWRHLAEAHYKGRYDFLTEYMNYLAINGDWVGWLRQNVELGTGTSLGMVFAGFLADYAGWGDNGYPGTYFGRRRWLKESFSGCEVVYLNKSEPVDFVDMDLRPLSGKCIEVYVAATTENGLSEGDSAAVQIVSTIISGPAWSRDALHLGLAASNDKKNFHCAREVKKHGKKGLGRCLFVPDDGKVRINGVPTEARSWNVIAQEKSDPSEQRQARDESRAELVNLYTVSYTPFSVSTKDTRYGGNDKRVITARFYFSLDVAELEFNGQKPASTGPAKKRTVGSFGENGDPQTTLPKQDADGSPANSYSLPEQFRPEMPPAPVPAGFVPGQLSVIIVSQQLWEGGSSLSDSAILTMTPAKQTGDDKIEPISLSVGETGSFLLSMSGMLAGEPLIELSPGALEVQEFTDLTFRARFSGTLCRTRELEPNKACRNPIPVSGYIVKAFAGTRLPGYQMVIERTPGTEMYRKAAEQGLAEWSVSSTDTDSETPGAASAEPGAPGIEPRSIESCACTCDEREQTTREAEDLKMRKNAGEEIDAGRLMGLMRCHKPCQHEYMICIMDENKSGAEVEDAHPEVAGKPLEKCACTCETLEALTHRKKQLETDFKPGDQASVDEIMAMSNCYQSCMSEFMSCR
jgi:hypothetical protein